MALYARAPALVYQLSSWNPNLKEAVRGLVIARYYSGSLGGGGYAGTAVLSTLTDLIDKHIQKGAHSTTFISHMAKVSPAIYGKSE